MNFDNVIKDNDIIQQALNGKPIDADLYSWLGCDILKLSYIKADLKAGKTPGEVAEFYGVSEEGLEKFNLI